MKTLTTARPVQTIASLALIVCLASTSNAPAALVHLWDFNAGNELADSAGSLNLTEAPGEGDVGGISGTAADIVYESGFNGIGQAYRPYYVDATQSSTAGAGLTGSGFTSPTQFTIETIVKVDAKTSGSAVNYLFQTRPGSDRGYYLIQDEDNVGGGAIAGVGSIIGNNFGDVGIAAEYDAPDTWLYVAVAIDHSPVGTTRADLYVANLSNGETTPTLVLDDRTWNTADALEGATGIFGIGNFAIDRNGDSVAEASQEWFQGAIDYVAIYDTLLGPSELEQNLAARLVPEPSSLALLGLGGIALLRRRRAV